MCLASSAIGVQFRSLSESGSSNIDNEADRATGCFCTSVAPRPSTLTSQSKRSGRDLMAITSQSGKARDRRGCEFRKESANDVSYRGLSRVVIGRMRRAMLGRGLR